MQVHEIAQLTVSRVFFLDHCFSEVEKTEQHTLDGLQPINYTPKLMSYQV